MSTFLTYCNTKQYFTNKWKGDEFDNSFYLSDWELKKYGITRLQLESMPQFIKIDHNRYNIQGVNEIDISLYTPSCKKLEPLHLYMLDCLKASDLPQVVEATAYWQTFIKHRNNYLNKFFKVDTFSGRVHTPISGMSKDIRPYLLLKGEQTTSFDVAQMQPTLLANILHEAIDKNDFSDAIFSGVDIYTMLQEKSNLPTRDKAKKIFFQILFGRPSNELEMLFANANFIEWINWYKSIKEERNPRQGKTYNNLAWILQNTEVAIMSEIWQSIAKKNILFLTVHDEIICQKSKSNQVKVIIESILKKHFKYFKLNEKHSDSIPAPVPEVPKLKKSLSEIAMELIGECNHLPKQTIIANMIHSYHIDETRAEIGFKSLLDNNIVEPTHLNTYVLSNSTPF